MQTTNETKPMVWTVQQVASSLNVHNTTVRRAMADGSLTYFRVGRAFRLRYMDLEQWLGPDVASSLFANKTR